MLYVRICFVSITILTWDLNMTHFKRSWLWGRLNVGRWPHCNVKLWRFPYTQVWHHVEGGCEVEVYHHSFIPVAGRWGDCPALPYVRFTIAGGILVSHWVWEWLGPRSVLGVWVKSTASSISILLLHILNIMVSKRGYFCNFVTAVLHYTFWVSELH